MLWRRRGEGERGRGGERENKRRRDRGTEREGIERARLVDSSS